MKKKGNHKKYFQVFIILGFILVLYVFYNLITYGSSFNKLQSLITNKRLTRLYKSDHLRISFYYPEDYTVVEFLGIVTLKNNIGKIIIDSNASNYQSIEEYIDYLEQINHVKVIDRSKYLINGLSSIYGVIQHPGTNNPDSLTYFYYPAKWTIFTISTDSKELKNDLDNIAKTFVFSL